MLLHVRYVTPPADGDPVAFLLGVLGRPDTWVAFGIGLIVLVGVIAVVLVKRPLAAPWSRFADRAWGYRPFVPWMVRLSAGLVLIGAGLTDRVFAPDVILAGWPTQLLTAVGFLLLVGLGVRAAAGVGLALFAIALVQVPHLVEIFDVAGAMAVVVFLGPGLPSLDDLLRAAFPRAPGGDVATRPQPIDRYGDVVPLIARIGLGGAFLASGIVDKLLVPDEALETVAKYHLTSVIPVDPGLWVVGAAAIESALGLAILVGLFTRPAAMIGFAVLTLTLFGLPDDPVIAHVALFGLASVVVILGPGRWSLDRRLGLNVPPSGPTTATAMSGGLAASASAGPAG